MIKKDQKDPVLPDKDAATGIFPPIDTETQGVVVGGGDTETLEFTEEGQRVVGVLMDVRQIDKPYDSTLYEVHNGHGAFSFWGGAVLDDRLEKIGLGKILDVTYKGDQAVKGGVEMYKTFTVKYFTPPEGFDPAVHTVYLNTPTNSLMFINKGDPVPETAIPF